MALSAMDRRSAADLGFDAPRRTCPPKRVPNRIDAAPVAKRPRRPNKSSGSRATRRPDAAWDMIDPQRYIEGMPAMGSRHRGD